MKRICLMMSALALFMSAPVLAQSGSAASDDSGGQASEGSAAPGMPGDNVGDDAVQDPEVVGQNEGEFAGDVTQPWAFAAFDENADGFLNHGEFGTGLFEFVAGDPAGLTPDQYQGTIEAFGLDDTVDFGTADVNGDSVVNDDQEFTPAVATRLFDRWDANSDDRLSSQEYARGMMTALDTNANGALEAGELEAHAGWFGTGDTQVAGGGGANGGFGEEFFLGEQVGPGIDATEEQDVGGPDDEGDEEEGDAGTP